MINLVSGATGYFNDPTTDKTGLGRFVSPDTWNDIDAIASSGYRWGADNSCFGVFPREKYIALLQRLARTDLTNFLFVTVPDVVADGPATLVRFRLWCPVIERYELPKALVAQNGMEHLDLPWDHFDALFIGGDTEWKLSLAAARLIFQAKQRDKWVHIGRVNSVKRRAWFESLGADSYDGTGWSKFSRAMLPLATRAAKSPATQLAMGDLFL